MDLCLIAEGFSWFRLESWLAMLMVVAGLGFVIFVHELGHFLVAKACGVKCEKFYVGFDVRDLKIGNTVIIPKSLFKFQWGETEYGIGIVPLGGYVKMLGQDDNPAKAAEERERSLRRSESTDADASEDNNVEAAEAYELDPRSYQAKSVPQRMAIISAGVVMNLIFAVIFATIAYRAGVPDTPPAIGHVIPGSPAWKANVRPGTDILAINGQPIRRFREIQQTIALNGTKEPVELQMRNEYLGINFTKSITPHLVDLGKAKLAGIGVRSGATLQLSLKSPARANQAAEQAQPPFEGGDSIVQLDETPIVAVEQMRALFAQHPEKTFVVTVERAVEDSETPQRHQITLGPNPMKTVGMTMKFSPIEAVQSDSPAAKAGIQVGDELIAIDGQPVGDPFTLSQRLVRVAAAGQSVEVTVRRPDHEEDKLTLTVKPRLPWTSPVNYPDAPIAIDELGICFFVLPEVSAVTEGGSAARAGIQAGDEITKVRFVIDKRDRALAKKYRLNDKPIKMKDLPQSWHIIHERLNGHLPHSQFEVTFKRGDDLETVTLEIENSTQWFLPTRGIALQIRQEIYQAHSWGQALSDGFKQTKEDATAVYRFLKKLVTGEISAINLGGPGTIAVGATSEALQSPTRLLLFLTLISANLAIVNFLPIPILDGGHMVFLAWEGIFRKPISEKLMLIFSLAGLVFIVGLMLFVITLDVWRFTW